MRKAPVKAKKLKLMIQKKKQTKKRWKKSYRKRHLGKVQNISTAFYRGLTAKTSSPMLAGK